MNNYIGSKVAMYFAFMKFYSCFLFILILFAIPSIVLTYLFPLDMPEVYFLAPYSFIVIVWCSLFNIKWKRKASEIALKCGQNLEKKFRPEDMNSSLNNNEFIDKIIRETNKQNSANIKSILLINLIQLLISVMLISICIGVLVFIRSIRNSFQSPTNIYFTGNNNELMLIGLGMIYGLSITILDYFYRVIICKIENKNNFHHSKDYELVLIFKRFAFSILIGNIEMMWTCFIEKRLLYFKICANRTPATKINYSSCD